MRNPAFAFLVVLVLGAQAHAAGLEKNIFWSGRYVGQGGAAVASGRGAESLFWNPAGLAGITGAEANLNFSPTISKYKGPIVGVATESNSMFSPIASAFASYGMSDKWTIGAGYYLSGGSRAVYEGVDFTALDPTLSLKPNLKNDVAITEFSLGTAYEVMPGLRLGAAWRIVHVAADLGSVATAGGALLGVEFNGLSATEYGGFRVGAQYAPPGSAWGVGATWRSAVDFAAKTNSSGKVETLGNVGSADPADLTGSETTVAATFPMQIGLGGYYDFSPKKFRFLAEYVWTEYRVDQKLDYTGSVTLPASLGGTTVPLSDTTLDWSNLFNVRAGFEYGLSELSELRWGYVYTSQVTPANRASALFAAPGPGHSLTLGAGTLVCDGKLGLDGALEYSWDAGTPEGATTEVKVTAMAAHLGATYRF
jgi:long-chain fatty acid transport protein